MSMDYDIYFNDPGAFSNAAFEDYCAALGLRVKLHPDFHLLADSGFVPVCLTDGRFSPAGAAAPFMTGFEAFLYPYRPEPPAAPKPAGLFGWLKKKPREETPFEQAIKGSAYVWAIRCRGGDSFEPLIAYLLGAYCVSSCGGIFDDPQFGRYYRDAAELEDVIAVTLDELIAGAEAGTLRSHPFEGWL